MYDPPGGAGEGKQPLTPQGGQLNPQEVKTDEILPFYCRPPNPCPKGFTGWSLEVLTKQWRKLHNVSQISSATILLVMGIMPFVWNIL